MELLLSILQIPILIYLIRYLQKQHSEPIHKHYYYYLLSFKVTCGLCLGMIYYQYYRHGDTIEYQLNLEVLKNTFYADFKTYLNIIISGDVPSELKKMISMDGQPRALFFVRLISPFYIVSGGNYWILSVYLSVFSFSGMWILSDTLIRLFKLNTVAVLVSFFLVPSIVFWSSGLLKDGLALGIICYLLSFFLNLVHKQNNFSVFRLIIMLLFLWILLQIKFYYFAVLVGTLIPYCLIKILSYKVGWIRNNKGMRILCLFGLIFLLGILASLSHPLLHLNRISDSLYLNYTITQYMSKGNNVFYFDGLNAGFLSFIPHIPKALIYGILGPFLWQCKKVIAMFAGIENTVILILLIVFIMTNFKKEKLKRIEIEEISMILYICILAIFMAFASPNWGTLIRYRVSYLPFLMLLLLNNNPLILQLEERIKRLVFSEKKN